MNTEPYYYIDMQGQRQGPVTFGELQNIALLPETLVWHAGTKQWLPARRFRALAPLVNAEAPPAPPPPDSTLNEAGRSVFFRPDRFVRSVIRYTLLIHPIFWIIQRIIFFSGFPERNIIPNATLAFLFSTGLLLLSFLMLLGLATCGLLLRAGHRLGRPVTLWVIGIHITGLLLLVILRTILFFSDTTSLALGWVVLPIIPLVCEVTILIGLLVRPMREVPAQSAKWRNLFPKPLLIPLGSVMFLALLAGLMDNVRYITSGQPESAANSPALTKKNDKTPLWSGEEYNQVMVQLALDKMGKIMAEAWGPSNLSEAEMESRLRGLPAQLRTIHLDGCPVDFRTAMVAYIQAWDALRLLADDVAQFNQRYNSDDAKYEALFRGLLGDINMVNEALEDRRRNDVRRQTVEQNLADTLSKLEVIAVSYGAKIPWD